eukprot:2867519-Pyramimonas_sp.AAC.1
MRTVPPGLSVELPMRRKRGDAEKGVTPACELCHWGLMWISPWGHATCEGCTETDVTPTCELCHWGLRWRSLWSQEECEGCAERG